MKNLISFALVALLGIGVAVAQKPHINKSDQPNVVATCNEQEVCFSGVVAGNGNASQVTAYLLVSISADTYCFNPAGGAGDNGVPGHIDQTIQGEAQTFDCQNGKATLTNICASLNLAVDCPNSKWSYTVENLSVSKVELVINGKTLDVTSYYGDCL